MSDAIGRQDLFHHHFLVFHIIDPKPLRPSKVLEDLTIFISYCDTHLLISFLFDQTAFVRIELIGSARNMQGLSFDDHLRQLSSRTVIDRVTVVRDTPIRFVYCSCVIFSRSIRRIVSYSSMLKTIASFEDGLRQVEFANSIYESAWKDKTVIFPGNEEDYDKLLQNKIEKEMSM